MAGKICPHCGEQTFFLVKGNNRKCSKCGCEMIVPPNQGKGGKGKKCPNCGQYTLFNDYCNNCGAKFIVPK